MIEPTKGHMGKEMARCTCDVTGCFAVVEVAAAHGNNSGRGVKIHHGIRLTLRNEGQVTTKLRPMGWEMVRGKLLCPEHAAARRAAAIEATPTTATQQEVAMPKPAVVADNVAPLREPSREQKRQIIDLLGEVYDLTAQRYKGQDTDKTVAEVIGGGCMPGWVAKIREDLFGPDGGNAEMEAAIAATAELQRRAEALDADAAGIRAEVIALERKAGDLQAEAKTLRTTAVDLLKRLGAIRAAVGPKATSI